MRTLQTTATSPRIPPSLRLQILTASECPSSVESLGQDIVDLPCDHLVFHFPSDSAIHAWQTPRDGSDDWKFEEYDHWNIDLSLWKKMAAGEEIYFDVPLPWKDFEGVGYASLFWIVGMGGKPLEFRAQRLFHFVLESPLEGGVSFTDWKSLRFPDFYDGNLSVEGEAKRLFLYRRWIEETHPLATHPSHREILHQAAVDNFEYLVAAVLEEVGGLDEGPIEKITETALGIAMDNHGDFGNSATFIGACHRRYRDDDFTMIEDRETWLPRAKRIMEMLKAAGAVDFFPIIKACEAGDVDEVRRLLAAGFPPNFAIYGYSTTLCEAAAQGHLEVCRLLLQAGADTNLPRPFDTHLNFGGRVYPLQGAGRHSAILKLLLEAGADPTLRFDDDRGTPVALHGAFRCAEGAKLIFSRVSFTSLRDLTGKTGLHRLSFEQLRDCREYIPEEFWDAADYSGVTPLMHAVAWNDFAKAEFLLRCGASPDRLSTHGLNGEARALNFSLRQELPNTAMVLTPLQMALLRGDYSFLQMLFAHGAKRTQEVWQLRDYHTLPVGTLDKIGELVSHYEKAISPENDTSRRFVVSRSPICPGYEWLLAPYEARVLLLLSQAPELCEHFDAIVEKLDVLALARELGLSEMCCRAYEKGGPLEPRELILLAREAIGAANQIVTDFAATLQSGESSRDSYQLFGAIDRVEEIIFQTKTAMGEAHATRSFSSELQAVASGEFDGGAARAREAVQTTGEVEFDDFIDALQENVRPGSTMDFGKLVQAAQRLLLELDEECAALLRKL